MRGTPKCSTAGSRSRRASCSSLTPGEGSRSATYYAAWALNEKEPDAAVAVSVAKAYASDAYRKAGNLSIQVQGGMGFTWENDAHLHYRRAKGSELAFGDATFHRERIARLLIKR